MNWNLGALCASVVLNTVGAFMIRQSAKMEDRVYFVAFFLISGLSFFVALIFYSYGLRKLSLSFAQPFVAGLGLASISVLSWALLGETLSFYGALGVTLILAGVVFLTL